MQETHTQQQEGKNEKNKKKLHKQWRKQGKHKKGNI